MDKQGTVYCGNCGAKGPIDSCAYDGAGGGLEMWNHRRAADNTGTLDEIVEAFTDRDWCRFALLVSGAPEIELPGKAHFAMREIAVAAIERLKYEEQKTHLESVTDYAINAEREIKPL